MTDSKTATERLRELLDERGVEWQDGDASYTTEWTNANGQRCSAMYWKPTLDVLMSGLTPEQAIAATLGAGECEDMGGTDANGSQVFSCSECGCVLSLYDSDGVNTLCTRFVHDYPRFCPQCGRKVKR